MFVVLSHLSYNKCYYDLMILRAALDTRFHIEDPSFQLEPMTSPFMKAYCQQTKSNTCFFSSDWQ